MAIVSSAFPALPPRRGVRLVAATPHALIAARQPLRRWRGWFMAKMLPAGLKAMMASAAGLAAAQPAGAI